MKHKYFDDLKGKVCLITGGGGVIGSYLALELAHYDLEIAILDYKKERCDSCADTLSREVGKEITCIVGNVLDRDWLEKSHKDIHQKLGKVDILINAAGGNAPEATTGDDFARLDDLSRSIFGIDITSFRSVFDLNLMGTLLPTLIFARDMAERGGVILNVSSMSALRPLTRVPAYSAAKSAVNNLTQWLAVHLSHLNIRVNAIAPGFLLTGQNRFLLLDEKSGELTTRGRQIIEHTPMGRFGEPADLLGSVLYLISDMSKFITGVVLPVDGGFSAYSGV
ncbi:MAG: SDR family oxidoreductase [Calditrichia bacterium]